MKKVLAVVLALLAALSVSILLANAGENSIDVLVTIADKEGKLALAMKEVTVTDIDNDEALTVNDALYAAHEQNFTGGAAAGYATVETQYGKSLTKLWGIADGFNYGYMVNDLSAMSLTDPVKEGDYIAAYCFTDTKNFADKYSFFTERMITAPASGEVSLTLKKNDFDPDWKPLVLPVAGAQITVDGNPSSVYTDVNGQATVTLTGEGKHLISAVATNQVIVPPVCAVTVSADGTEAATEPATDSTNATEAATEAQTEAATESATEDVTEFETQPATEAATMAPATKDQATKDQATKDQTAGKTTSSPKTGDTTKLLLWILITVVCLGGIIGAVIFYKKRYKNDK